MGSAGGYWHKRDSIIHFQNHREFCISHFPGQVLVCAFIRVFILLFNGISTLLGYLMPNPSFYKNSADTI